MVLFTVTTYQNILMSTFTTIDTIQMVNPFKTLFIYNNSQYFNNRTILNTYSHNNALGGRPRIGLPAVDTPSFTNIGISMFCAVIRYWMVLMYVNDESNKMKNKIKYQQNAIFRKLISIEV